MKLNELMRGPYRGLYGEVVTTDCYRLRSVQFQPKVIFDVGGNIGIFSRFARQMFPEATIIVLEPDPQNCAHFRQFTTDMNTVLIPKALGRGRIFHATTARNGSGEVYLSPGLGYEEQAMEKAASLRAGLETSKVESITLAQLAAQFSDPEDPILLKIDCEGGENSIWADPDSVDVLKRAQYIAAELHFYAQHGGLLDIVRSRTMAGLHELDATHDWTLDNVHFWATKKRS